MHEFDYLPILLVYETYIPIKRKDSREISVHMYSKLCNNEREIRQNNCPNAILCPKSAM